MHDPIERVSSLVQIISSYRCDVIISDNNQGKKAYKCWDIYLEKA